MVDEPVDEVGVGEYRAGEYVCVEEREESDEDCGDGIDRDEEGYKLHPALLVLHVCLLLVGDHLLLSGAACDDGSAFGAELHGRFQLVAALGTKIVL